MKRPKTTNRYCPSCKKKDVVLHFIVQGVLQPEAGFGISYWEFEDVLEEGKISFIKEFFENEFDIQYSRTGDEFSLVEKSGKTLNLKEIYAKTQKDGKLQRMIYNVYYVLLQGM